MKKKHQTGAAKRDLTLPRHSPQVDNVITLPQRYTSIAKATHQVTERATTYGLQTLQDNELRSIYTLFAWVSNEQHAAQETVRSMTEVHFGIDDVTKLKKRDYDEVIKFLVDLRIDEMKH